MAQVGCHQHSIRGGIGARTFRLRDGGVDAVARLSQSRPSDAPISRPHRIQKSCSILGAVRIEPSNVSLLTKIGP